jgi:translation initiation factor 4E
MRKGETSSHSNRNPFNSPALASPTTGASSAFGLGTGAFASFGSAKTPKTPGTALDFGSVVGLSTKTPVAEKSTKEVEAKLADMSVTEAQKKTAEDFKKMTLRYTWVFWVRPPVHKSNGFVEYEKTVHEMVKVSNVNDYWVAFKHLKHPSTLPVVTDRHMFKDGIRPIWEDADNKKGGKWELRLKKGIADRYFDETQLALIGDWFDDSEEICGAVISVRNGEDILSMWLRDNDSHKNIKIRYILQL